ncbi:MAG: serine protease, partial [Armatimonadota bacterium]|nr:serine protease [Armatimonadota bacterium]
MGKLNSRFIRTLALPFSLAGLILFGSAPLAADETGAAARAIADKHGGAVVPVRVVIKMRVAYEGEEVDEEESSNELNATVIDPSGLALCALSEVDPTHMIELWQEEDPNYKIDAQVTDLKFVLPEGKEIPAKVVLRDRDLDLAFIRPVALPDQPFVAVDLAQSAQPQIMDEIVVLGRLGDVANRELRLALDRITAVVTKPRTLYIAGIA